MVVTTDPADMKPGLAASPTVDNDGLATPHSAGYLVPAGGTGTGTGFGFHAAPDYSVVKTADRTVVRNYEPFTYTIVVRNNGTIDGRNVLVTDNFPTDVIEILDAGGGTVDVVAGTIVWEIPALDVGEQQILLVEAAVRSTSPAGVDDVVNAVSVTDDRTNGDDPTPENNTSTEITPLESHVDYRVTITDDLEDVGQNDPVTYTVVASNVGLQDGTGVVVTVRLQVDVLEDITPSHGGTHDPATGLVTWPVGDLPSGQTVILTITAKVPGVIPVGTPQTTADALIEDDTTNGPDANPADNIDRDTTDLPEFVFDSIRDPSGGGKELTPLSAGGGSTLDPFEKSETRTDPFGLPPGVSGRQPFRAAPLPVDTVYTGIVDPGTTLSGKIYDIHGRLIGEQTVVADAAGNWLMQFPTVVLYEHPHEMRMEQTLSIQNSMADAGFNMRRFFHPAIHTQIFMTEPLSVGAAFRHTPWNILADMHAANTNPLAIGWNHHSYELTVASTNVAAR